MTNNQSYSQWLSIIHILPRSPPDNPLVLWTMLRTVATAPRSADTIIIIDVTILTWCIEHTNIAQKNN